MTITEAITATHLRAVGKATAPAVSSSKYSRIVGLLDFYQRAWSKEPGTDWNSLYDPAFSIGTVTATDTFDLDTSTIRKISDREGDTIRIVHTDDTSYTDYTVISHDKLKDDPNGFYCAQIGDQLRFVKEFTSDDAQYGGEIFVPCYTFTDSISTDNVDTDEVQVDDPDWLVIRCAAEYVRNDITRRSRYPELVTEANERMITMKDNNEGQIITVDRPWTPFTGSNDWS